MTDILGTISANGNTPEGISRPTSGTTVPFKNPDSVISEIERSILAEAAKAYAEGQAFCVDVCIDESRN